MVVMLGNFFVQVFLTYYIYYILRMIFNKQKRLEVQTINKEMNKLRDIPIKTLDEQKKFMNLRYPKQGKFKWNWMMIPKTILAIGIFIFVYRGWRLLFAYFGITIKIWLAVIIIMIIPILMNIILEKFNLERTDWRVFIK